MIDRHPLMPVTQGLDRVPLRRPRFSNTEALILNTLINANGKVVTAQKLALICNIMRQSVPRYIYMLRAKLGEVKYQPTLIITVYADESNNWQGGWTYQDQ